MQLVERPRLELSGPKLKLALEALLARAEELGGVEAYVDALRLKSTLFAQALEALDLKKFRALCAHMPTVRRRIGQYAQPHWFDEMKNRILALIGASGSPDERMARF